jgi:hypothetical protein
MIELVILLIALVIGFSITLVLLALAHYRRVLRLEREPQPVQIEFALQHEIDRMLDLGCYERPQRLCPCAQCNDKKPVWRP